MGNARLEVGGEVVKTAASTAVRAVLDRPEVCQSNTRHMRYKPMPLQSPLTLQSINPPSPFLNARKLAWTADNCQAIVLLRECPKLVAAPAIQSVRLTVSKSIGNKVRFL